MRWTFQNITEDFCYLRVKVEDAFQINLQKRMLDEICNLDYWKDGIPILFDNRQLDLTGNNADSMRESVNVLLKFSNGHPNTKIAGLVSTDLNFGFGRQFHSFSEIEGSYQFNIFRDEEAAIEWLFAAPSD